MSTPTQSRGFVQECRLNVQTAIVLVLAYPLAVYMALAILCKRAVRR